MRRIRAVLERLTKGRGGGGGRDHAPDEVKPLRREEYDRRYRMTLREWLLYHQKEVVFTRVSWMGVSTQKSVLDAWVYQELLHRIKPDVLVEIGSKYGGSTRYFADLMTILGHGVVISIDIDRSGYRLVHDRVIELTGSSSEPGIVAEVGRLCRDKQVMVIQDGDHGKDQCLADLRNYTPLVGVGSYFIMEDGIVDLFHAGDGLGFDAPGPLAAVEEFLLQDPRFVVDESLERYLLTYNPRGFLKRVKP